jgi:hypothetical protein
MKRIMFGRIALSIALALATAAPVAAQWLVYRDPRIPRTADGRPNLSAPAPRMPDGKPDLSGMWGLDAGASLFYIIGGLKPDEIKPSALEALQRRGSTPDMEDQPGCHPEGPRFNHFIALSSKIVQTPTLIVVLAENLTYRQIFLDGRPLPDVSNPSWMGYSVGHWEGDTLVVETIGYKDMTALDLAGSPHTEGLRLVERYRRSDFGHMEIEETLSDPALYSRPIALTVKGTLVPDTDMLEYVCAENEKDHRDHHLVGTSAEEQKSVKPVTLPANVLSQYVGSYDFRWPEQPTIASIWEVTMRDGMLFLAGAPLISLSETQFVWGGGERVRFEKDAQGRISHFVFAAVEGDLVAKRLR